MHQTQVLHEDPMPRNTMVSEDSDRVLWIDFDFAQTFPEDGALSQRHKMWFAEGVEVVQYFIDNIVVCACLWILTYRPNTRKRASWNANTVTITITCKISPLHDASYLDTNWQCDTTINKSSLPSTMEQLLWLIDLHWDPTCMLYGRDSRTHEHRLFSWAPDWHWGEPPMYILHENDSMASPEDSKIREPTKRKVNCLIIDQVLAQGWESINVYFSGVLHTPSLPIHRHHDRWLVALRFHSASSQCKW